MNHLWERQSKALGLDLVREQIGILVGNPLQPQSLIFLKVLLHADTRVHSELRPWDADLEQRNKKDT